MPLAPNKCEKEALLQLDSKKNAGCITVLCGTCNEKFYKLIPSKEKGWWWMRLKGYE